MSQQNSNSQRDVSSSSFHFEEYIDAKAKSPKVLVQKNQSDCQLIPFLKDFQFKPCKLQKDFQNYADQIRNVKIRKDDVWVLALPKSGTTWLTNIVSQLTQGFDFATHKYHISENASLESIYVNTPGRVTSHARRMEILNEMESAPSPRIMVSHLPPQLLPVELWTVQPKMIYIARNPKDVIVSMYYMLFNMSKDESRSICSKGEFFDEFLRNVSPFGPYDTHILSGWQLRHLNNFLFLKYEELLADRFQGVKMISEFLECQYSNEDLEKLAAYVSFDNMKQKNEKVSTNLIYKTRFFRRGKAGGFTDEMSKEQIEKFDEWIDKRFHTFGFKFAN